MMSKTARQREIPMITKWKVISSVMLLITLVCTVFAVLVQRLNDEKIAAIIDGKAESARVMAETLLHDFSSVYRDRAKTLTNPKVSPSRERMIRAFAERDRATLLTMSKPILKVFKENPHFSSIAWLTTDNRVFLRLHAPELFGDDVSKVRPDIVAANREEKQLSGFDGGVSGMQYRVVQPVFYKGNYIGLMQFGINASFIFDSMWDKLHVHAGMAVLTSESGTLLKSKLPGLSSGEYTISARDVETYHHVADQLDWSKGAQRVILHGEMHSVVNIMPVNNYKGEQLGVFFVALRISREVAQKRKLFFSVVSISGVILLISFFILYFSYGKLVGKIIVLNQTLERNNLELEERVKERTAKLHASEQQLYRAQKMEAIGLMAGGVAHDLNNILAGIIGYPELILGSIEKDSELRKPIEAIQESGERAATVVADLLTVARGVASTREVCNLNEVVQQYLQSPECEKQRKLYPYIIYQEQLLAENPLASCSSVHVKKCIMNLAINAAEAMAESGTITVATFNQSVDDVLAGERKMQAGEYLVISVLDTGSGIAKSDLEHIFEPFYTRKKMGRSGTGLGLAIVWSTMEDHQGKVFVESSAEGTCFQLYFPASKEENVLSDMVGEEEQYLGNNEHILVVDDELQVLDIAAQMLQSLGYRVSSVSSGEAALQFVAEEPVDLMVLDMQMDPGMNGHRTYAEISKRYPGQKAIVASGFSDSDDVRAAFKLGVGGFIKKPFTMEQLGRAVKEALKG